MLDRIAFQRSDRTALRLAAILLIAGILVTALAGLLHPEGADANDHRATFEIYANSGIWTAVHLGQFVGMAILVAGLGALFFALDAGRGLPRWLGRAGLLSAAVALALYGVLQAVDGVALKQAVDAWATAPAPEKAARFASAETVRWLEWAVRSYQSYMFGAALILFGASIAATRRLARAIGYLMALSGLAYLAQGWILGVNGFSSANRIPTLLGIVLVVVWAIWLLVAALRATAAQPQAAEVEALV
jgi:uncharacterized membrane protein HdeD (DUF308 family)